MHSHINRIARQFSNLSSQNLDNMVTTGQSGVVAPATPRRVIKLATVPSTILQNEITISEALQHMRDNATANFHEFIDAAVSLGVDLK